MEDSDACSKSNRYLFHAFELRDPYRAASALASTIAEFRAASS
jgi:hypothetical protein